jgi:hypothetical protein
MNYRSVDSALRALGRRRSGDPRLNRTFAQIEKIILAQKNEINPCAPLADKTQRRFKTSFPVF